MTSSARALVAATLLALALLLPVTAAPARETAPVEYERPVPGVVTDGFAPPPEPWQPGHRGVDLAAQPGEQVVSAGAGRVVFAGVVAGLRWVTVAHPDGVRTSYGPLAAIHVDTGADLVGGDPVGTVAEGHGAGLHWSARRDGRYVDPLSLLDVWRPALLPPGAVAVTDLPDVPSYEPWTGRRGGLLGAIGFLDESPVATSPGWPLAPNPNHVIGIAGLGSSTGRLPIDLTHLGYTPDQITYLSYAGRSGTAPYDPRDPVRDQLPYGPGDTWKGVHAAALRLREQLRAHHAAHPGEAVDLVGHSMGGVVALHYLLTLHDPADPTLPPIGHAVTIASPLEGADLARGVLTAAGGSRVVGGLLELVGAIADQPDPDDPAVGDLAVGSSLVDDLGRAWAHARDHRYEGPLATGTQVLTLGGSRDVVVPERRSDLPGADHVVLPGGHDHVRLTEASRIVVRSFLADQPVPGRAGGVGHVLSYPLGWGEQLAGHALAGLP